MDPIIGGALISGGSGILGGLFGGKSKPYKMDGQIWDAARGARLASEDFGFNPLTLLGIANASGGGSYGGENYMGQAIANAGLTMADALMNADKAKVSTLERANQELNKKVQSLTIRPKFAGIYGDNTTRVPTIRAALGAENGPVYQTPDAGVSPVSGADDGAAGDLRPLMAVDGGSAIADSRRPVENDPVKTHSGYITIDNPNSPIPLRVPTLDGDEALQWYDIPSLAIPGALAAHDFIMSPAFEPRNPPDADPDRKKKPYRPNKNSPGFKALGWKFDNPKPKKKKGPLAPLGF